MNYPDIYFFTQGYCYALALELHKRAGFGLRVLYGEKADHALVQTPDGQYLDVRGLQSRRVLDAFWGKCTLQAVGPSFFADWSFGVAEDIGRLYPSRLDRVATRLLKNLVTLKCTECPAIKMVPREPCFYDFKEVETICPGCVKDTKKVKAHERRLRATKKK